MYGERYMVAHITADAFAGWDAARYATFLRDGASLSPAQRTVEGLPLLDATLVRRPDGTIESGEIGWAYNHAHYDEPTLHTRFGDVVLQLDDRHFPHGSGGPTNVGATFDLRGRVASVTTLPAPPDRGEHPLAEYRRLPIAPANASCTLEADWWQHSVTALTLHPDGSIATIAGEARPEAALVTVPECYTPGGRVEILDPGEGRLYRMILNPWPDAP